MTPSDHFVLFYNEIFKFLAKRGPKALKQYYGRVAERQAFFTLEAFKRDGFKGMFDYWERIRIEENCQMRNAYDDVHYEAEMLRCPSLSKALESDAGVCSCYCDHCPGWVVDVIGRAGCYCVYDMIGREAPRCRYFAYRNRDLAEAKYWQCVAESGVDVVRTNVQRHGLVCGRLSDFGRICPSGSRMEKAAEFLRSADLSRLPLGRHEISGSDVYVNIVETTLNTWSSRAQLETHRQYIDVHIPLTVPEVIGYAYDEENVRCLADGFNEKDDYVVFKNESQRPIHVAPGEFAAFFPPYGAHAPSQTDGASLRQRKAIVKVRV